MLATGITDKVVAFSKGMFSWILILDKDTEIWTKTLRSSANVVL
jgi:hypothetical protein